MILLKNKEDFNYYKDGKFEKIDLNDLINKSSQIYIRPINSNINNKNDEGKPKIEDVFEEKCKKLKFFKDLVVDLEEIYDKMLILRVKGCNIPRIIKINIKYLRMKNIRDFCMEKYSEKFNCILVVIAKFLK